MYLTVKKESIINKSCTIPSSKPETQRGIIVGALASGESIIHNDLRCFETRIMKDIFIALGAKIDEKDGYLRIEGVGGKFQYDGSILDAVGSGLAFRVAAAITSVAGCSIPITGDKILRERVMQPLFKSLEHLGAKIDYLADKHTAPIINRGVGIKGGECCVEGNISSQFITALMFVAPLSENGIKINITNEILSKSYLRQTIEFLKKAGIDISYSAELDYIEIHKGSYSNINVLLSGDMTSASYFLALAALFKGTYLFKNINSDSLQGEKYFINVIEELGIVANFNQETSELRITNDLDELSGNYHFDISNCPNILPTLAALGSFVNGEFKVTGGSITRFHKSNRITAIVSELKKLGVDINIIYKDDIPDGFIINGKNNYTGGQVLSSWGDHRIFMSLFIISLKMESGNKIDGYRDVVCSFPSFFEQIRHMTGADYSFESEQNQSITEMAS